MWPFNRRGREPDQPQAESESTAAPSSSDAQPQPAPGIERAFRIYDEFDALLANARNHLARAARIETNDNDDLFVRVCISGFLENAPVDDWGRSTYGFIIDARKGEFRDENLQEYFGEDWREMGLYHCLVVGYNLGLSVSGKIDDEQFSTYEIAAYPYGEVNRQRIVEAFRE